MSTPLLVSSDPSAWWSGYRPELEDHAALRASAVNYDWGSLPRSVDIPDVFSIADWWDVEQQGPVGRCAGEAGAAVGEVEHYKMTGQEIQFNGHATYIWAQQRTSWYGADNGTSVQSVMQSLKDDGACPIDWDRDGKADYPKPPRYTTQIPPQAKSHAAKYRFGYHAVLNSFDDILAFQQTQGSVFIGASWGNWGPDSSGLCDTWGSGGGGHAWAIPGYDLSRRRFSQRVLEGVNSHGLGWGKRGFHWMTERFVNAMLRDRFTVCVGMSRMSIPGPTKYSYAQWRKAIST